MTNVEKIVLKQKIDFVEKPVLKQSSLRHFCQVWQSGMMLASAPKWTKSFLNAHTNTKGAHANPKWAKSVLNTHTNTEWSKSFLNAYTNTKRAHINTKWAKSFLNAHTNNKYKVSQILRNCAHKYKKSAHTFKVGQILPKGAHKYGTNSCGNKKQEISSSKKSSSTVKMDEFN